jgi:PST family polysaccharide transporter
VYPYISRLAAELPGVAVEFLRREVRWVGISASLISAGLFLLAPQIVSVVLGDEYTASIPVVRILSFLPVIIVLGISYANLFLLAFGYTKIWGRIITASSFASIVGAFVFTYLLDLKHVGMSMNAVFTEMLILVWSFLAYKRLGHEALASDMRANKCLAVRSATSM